MPVDRHTLSHLPSLEAPQGSPRPHRGLQRVPALGLQDWGVRCGRQVHVRCEMWKWMCEGGRCGQTRLQSTCDSPAFQMSIKQLSLNHVKEGIKEEEEEGENEDWLREGPTMDQIPLLDLLNRRLNANSLLILYCTWESLINLWIWFLFFYLHIRICGKGRVKKNVKFCG